MLNNMSSNIIRCWITQFDCVYVEHFTEAETCFVDLAALLEMFFNQIQEFSADICLNIKVEWGIELGNFPIFSFFLHFLFVFRYV